MKIYLEQVITTVQILTPYVKKIAEEKIIPWAKKQYYKAVNRTVVRMLKKLAELGEKTLVCEDKAKKAQHKIGFKLGYEFVCTLEILVNEAKQTLSEINNKLDYEYPQIPQGDLIDEDEIPF